MAHSVAADVRQVPARRGSAMGVMYNTYSSLRLNLSSSGDINLVSRLISSEHFVVLLRLLA